LASNCNLSRFTSSHRLRRDSVRSTEAGLKYFILGALSSGLLLYRRVARLRLSRAPRIFSGIIAATATEGEMSIGLLIGLVFLISGLAFKVSAAPFHMWTPDVYEGAPTAGHGASSPPRPRLRPSHCWRVSCMTPLAGAVGDWQQVVAFAGRLVDVSWAPLPPSGRPTSSA
jgi:NADH-quinone oxidoreductase subunit N